jgi:hypothetical protein
VTIVRPQAVPRPCRTSRNRPHWGSEIRGRQTASIAGNAPTLGFVDARVMKQPSGDLTTVGLNQSTEAFDVHQIEDPMG